MIHNFYSKTFSLPQTFPYASCYITDVQNISSACCRTTPISCIQLSDDIRCCELKTKKAKNLLAYNGGVLDPSSVT